LNLSESKVLLHNQANTDVATTPVATTINISSTTSGLVSVPQTAKVRSLHEHQSNSSVYNDAFVNTTNSHSTQPKSSQSDVYNNGKDHLTQSKVIFCSLPKKRLTMVVHLFSVAFVIAVAIVMRTGTSLFSWHPFFMSLGVVFFIAQAILVFSPSSSLIAAKPRAFKVKTHWILHLCGVACVIIGFIIIYVNKEINDKPHAKTWHGFLGYASVLQFCAHCLGGVCLLYPLYVKNYFTLAQLKQMHATIGLLGFFLAATVLVLGLMSKAFLEAVTLDVAWYAFACVPVILAGAIGNQVTTAYGPKKVKASTTAK